MWLLYHSSFGDELDAVHGTIADSGQVTPALWHTCLASILDARATYTSKISVAPAGLQSHFQVILESCNGHNITYLAEVYPTQRLL
jgi:hypothetical protein